MNINEVAPGLWGTTRRYFYIKSLIVYKVSHCPLALEISKRIARR